MTVVAEFTLPPDALPGGEAFSEVPGLTIEVERIVPTRDAALPFFWVSGGDLDRFVEFAAKSDDIESIEVLEEVDQEGSLVKATWLSNSPVIRGLRQLDATIMNATGTAEEWRFRVRGDTRADLDAFQRVFTEQGIAVQLERIYNLSEMAETERPLTESQRETLVFAYHNGYFDDPRGITQEGIAEHFGVSPRAISNRLRRGMRNLVASNVVGSVARDRDDERY